MDEPAKNDSENGGIDDYGNVIVTGKELADVLALSEAHVFTLKRRHIIQSIRAHKNQYHLGPAVRAYVAYKCGQDSSAEADFHKERALKERANRELRQILVQQTWGQLHRAEDVEAIQAASNCDIRFRLLKFGNLLSSQIAGKTDPAEVKAVIDSEVRKVLNKLREFNPRDYYRRCKIAHLNQEQSQDEQQQSTGRIGWKKGRPRPEASESNRQRWAANPEKLTETLRKMNAAKQAGADEVRAKISRAAKKRWQTIPPEQK